jgi:hypothetical protein
MKLGMFFFIFFCWIHSGYSWYFPEHALISEEGLRITPNFAKKILDRNYKKLLESKENGGPKLCPNIDAPYFDDTKETQDLCIPYSSLPALAADHSNYPAELKDFLFAKGDEMSLALRIVQGTQDHWKEVHLLELKKQSDAKRRSLIRKLDIFLTIVDPDYLTRAQNHSTHFAPADEIYPKVIKELVENGRVDNLLNQFIVHHLRSLQYARLSKYKTENQAANRWIAFLEHAFAIHFLEDAFAAGHLVMYAPYLTPESNYNRLMRHDYFNRNGLDVSRSRSPLACSYFRLLGEKSMPGIEDPSSVCWVTFGDGFLNKGNGKDLEWAAKTVADVEVSFAMAFEPEEFKRLLNNNICTANNKDEIEKIFANTNPFNPWNINQDALRVMPWTCEEKGFVIKKKLDSLDYLEKTPLIKEINANSNEPVPNTISEKQIGQPYEVCVGIKEFKVDPDSVKRTKELCPPKMAINFGKPDISLLTNNLTSMPVSQADKKELLGSDPFSSAVSSQLSIGFPYLTNFGSQASSFIGVNFQFGFSYRLEYVIADNPNFGAAEILAGIYNAAQIGRGNPDPLTIANFEFRSALPNWGIDLLFKKLYFNLFKEGKPKYEDIVGQFSFTYSWLTGFRYYAQLIEREGKGKLYAWDIEVFTINFPLNDEIRGLERISRIPSQLRLRMGADNQTHSFMIGLEFAVGFSRSF